MIRISHYPRRDGPLPEGARWVGRPSRWGNPFKPGGPNGLARVPAVHYPDQPWEYEGRISAHGMRHDYHHGDGRVTVCHVRRMTVAESVECYRAWLAGGGWPIDWAPRFPPLDEWLAPLLDATALACACPLGQPCHADVLVEAIEAVTHA